LRTLTGTAQRPPVGTSQTLPGHQEDSLRARENRECESFAMYLKLIAKLLVVKTQAKSLCQYLRRRFFLYDAVRCEA